MSKKIKMKDIAMKLGLSINAVSIALNNKNGVGAKTRKLILNTAEKMGYFEENNKYRSVISNRNICVITKMEYFRDSSFYGKVLLGVEQEAKLMGYDININFSTESLNVPSCIVEGRVCGIILIGRTSDEFIRKLMKYRLPMVTTDHVSLMRSVDSIMSDNKHGVYQITQMLINKGFTKIGFLGDLQYSMSVKERFFGYQEGISLLPHIKNYQDIVNYTLKYSVLENIETFIIGHNLDCLEERLRSIQQMPQALICSNDEAAIQVMRVLNRMNYDIPNDISVTGFDDIDFATMCIPKLTTVHVRKESMGKIAVQKLKWRMENPDKPLESTILSVKVVERESVK